MIDRLVFWDDYNLTTKCWCWKGFQTLNAAHPAMYGDWMNMYFCRVSWSRMPCVLPPKHCVTKKKDDIGVFFFLSLPLKMDMKFETYPFKKFPLSAFGCLYVSDTSWAFCRIWNSIWMLLIGESLVALLWRIDTIGDSCAVLKTWYMKSVFKYIQAFHLDVTQGWVTNFLWHGWVAFGPEPPSARDGLRCWGVGWGGRRSRATPGDSGPGGLGWGCGSRYWSLWYSGVLQVDSNIDVHFCSHTSSIHYEC